MLEKYHSAFKKLKEIHPHRIENIEKLNEFLKYCTDIKTLKILRKKLFKFVSNEQDKLLIISALQLLIRHFLTKSKSYLEELIEGENSALIMASIFYLLKSSEAEISHTLIKRIKDRFQKIYDLTSEEVEFILELELNLVSKLDFPIDYFTKFTCTSVETVKTQEKFDFAIKDHHLIALDLSRWDSFLGIPKSICQLSFLEYLNLRGLKIENLPENLYKLEKLKLLDVSDNDFNKIHEVLLKIAEKNIAEKYCNKGVKKSESILLALFEILKGQKLKRAKNDDNVLDWEQAVHYKINDKGNIIGIYIKEESSNIGIIPEIICSLKELRELELLNSRIKEIPNCLFSMEKIEYLDLNGNLISEIPRNLQDLKNLKYFDLEDNNISQQALYESRWYKSGRKSLEERDFELTIKECKKTLELFPNHVKAWFHLAIAYKYVNNPNESLLSFKKTLELDPSNHHAWNYLADIYQEKGNHVEAIHALSRALEYNPNDAIYWANLGYLYQVLKKSKKAIHAYKEALLLDLTNLNVIKSLEEIFKTIGNDEKELEMFNLAMDIEYDQKDLESLREKILKL